MKHFTLWNLRVLLPCVFTNPASKKLFGTYTLYMSCCLLNTFWGQWWEILLRLIVCICNGCQEHGQLSASELIDKVWKLQRIARDMQLKALSRQKLCCTSDKCCCGMSKICIAVMKGSWTFNVLWSGQQSVTQLRTAHRTENLYLNQKLSSFCVVLHPQDIKISEDLLGCRIPLNDAMLVKEHHIACGTMTRVRLNRCRSQALSNCDIRASIILIWNCHESVHRCKSDWDWLVMNELGRLILTRQRLLLHVKFWMHGNNFRFVTS